MTKRLPATLALVDGDAKRAAPLAAALQAEHVAVTRFDDADVFLTSPRAYEHAFYLFARGTAGVDALHLARLVRRRGEAGVIVLGDEIGGEALIEALNHGADMLLSAALPPPALLAAVAAVQRRAAGLRGHAWVLDRSQRRITAPDGATIELNPNDLAVLECFLAAEGRAVPREVLVARLWDHEAHASDNTLHAAMYRLRRRLERATTSPVPLRAQSRTGYVFRGELRAA